MKKTILFISLIALGACVSQKKLTPTQADADLAATKFPGMTMADLQEGQRLYTATCQKCHGLKNPKKFSETRLNEIVPIMAKKAKIDKATETKIHNYLVTLSQRSK
jgi:mono/diheme cytochrome c family protein